MSYKLSNTVNSNNINNNNNTNNKNNKTIFFTQGDSVSYNT